MNNSEGPTMPDDLIAKILPLMPFPFVFKARCLSKEWEHRCSPTVAGDSVQHGGEERLLAKSFQVDVQEHLAGSVKGMFYPVNIDRELCLAYDLAGKHWVRLPSLSFLPESLYQGARISLAGPGLALVTRRQKSEAKSFIVANTITRNWKQLPPRPIVNKLTRDLVYCCGRPRLVVDTLTGQYMVVAFSARSMSMFGWEVCIYESKKNEWKVIHIPTRVPQHWSFAFLNGVMYIVMHLPAEMFVLNLEEGNAEKRPLEYNYQEVEVDEDTHRHLVVWDGQLFMIVHDGHDAQVCIMKVDLESWQLSYVNRGPPNPDDCPRVPTTGTRFVSAQGSRLIFKHMTWPPLTPDLLWEYDLPTDRWTPLGFSPLEPTSLVKKGASSKLLTLSEDFQTRRPNVLTFEPGLNPFWQL